MAAKEKTFLLILLFVFICANSGSNDDVNNVVKHGILHAKPNNLKVIAGMKMRKLIDVNAMLDYYEAGPNPVHDPGKGKSGGRGGNNP